MIRGWFDMPPGPQLSPATCAIATEAWTAAQLAAVRTVHDRDAPKREGLPLVAVAVPDGSHIIVDRNTRANKLVRTAAPGPHAVVGPYFEEAQRQL